MKGMTVKTYLETVAKICTFEEAAAGRILTDGGGRLWRWKIW